MSTSTDTAAEPLRESGHLHGHFYFTDLKTTDVKAAGDFYAGMYGWSYDTVPDSDPPYVIASLDGRRKAAIACADEELRAQGGRTPYWFAYLTVADLDATLAKVEGLGGRIVVPAFEVMDIGRMAVVNEPTGAAFGLWQDAIPGETTVFNEHGSPFWYELHSTDVETSLAFFEQLVGWKRQANEMGPDLTYWTMEVPDATDPWQRMACGIMQQMGDEAAQGEPSRWYPYFNTDDPDAAAVKAVELGGTVVMEPHDIPEVGRSTWLADPTGGVFAAMHPNPPQQ